MLSEKEKQIIDRYISGNATPTEKEQVEKAMVTGEMDPHLRYRLMEDWNSLETDNNKDLSHVLDRVHHLLNLEEQKKNHSVVRRSLALYYRLAAVLLIPLLVGGIILTGRYSGKSVIEERSTFTITSPPGARISFKLPDGSQGFLNGGSTLAYGMPFHDKREVEISGEAWLDVRKDASRPFVVKMGNSSVKVLGTKFNVSAYEDDPYLDVVLESGMIEFRAHPGSEPVPLSPGEHLSMSGQSIHIEQTDTEKYSGWTRGLLIFRGDNMAEVARRIERWYNVKVTIAHSDLEEYVFVGTFEDDSLEEVLALLAMTSPIEYDITPRKKDKQGKWLKREVILTKSNL